jgi:hypothetical protein
MHLAPLKISENIFERVILQPQRPLKLRRKLALIFAPQKMRQLLESNLKRC